MGLFPGNSIISAALAGQQFKQRKQQAVRQREQDTQDEEQRKIENENAKKRLKLAEDIGRAKLQKDQIELNAKQAELHQQALEATARREFPSARQEQGATVFKSPGTGQDVKLTEERRGQILEALRRRDAREIKRLQQKGAVSPTVQAARARLLGQVQKPTFEKKLEQQLRMDKERDTARNARSLVQLENELQLRKKFRGPTGSILSTQFEDLSPNTQEGIKLNANGLLNGTSPRPKTTEGRLAIEGLANQIGREKYKLPEGVNVQIVSSDGIGENLNELEKITSGLDLMRDAILESAALGKLPDNIGAAAALGTFEQFKDFFGTSEVGRTIGLVQSRGFNFAKAFGSDARISDKDLAFVLQGIFDFKLTAQQATKRYNQAVQDMIKQANVYLKSAPREQKFREYEGIYNTPLLTVRQVQAARKAIRRKSSVGIQGIGDIREGREQQRVNQILEAIPQ